MLILGRVVSGALANQLMGEVQCGFRVITTELTECAIRSPEKTIQDKKALRIKHLCAFQSAVARLTDFNKWAVVSTIVVKAFRMVQDAIYLGAQTWIWKLNDPHLLCKCQPWNPNHILVILHGKKKKSHWVDERLCPSLSLTLLCSIICRSPLSFIPCVLSGSHPHSILSKCCFLVTANTTNATAIFLCLHNLLILGFPKN